MKKPVSVAAAALSLFVTSLAGSAAAAELLDVKPVTAAGSVVFEVTADIPMTYTYYKVPGQARAVVDIADADPEKVEPLIVVNKGAVASISVDKALIGDMTVSRLVFNLVAESDISVNHTPDRKTLNVAFSGDAAAPTAVSAPAAAPVPATPPVAETKSPSVATPAPEKSVAAAKEDDDPLGLDEPQAVVGTQAKQPATAATKSVKLEPVVPKTAVQTGTPVTVKGVVIGASYIDIQTSAPVENFKQTRLTNPERLSIEIPGTSSIKVTTVQVKRFGIGKVRVGMTPGVVRIVLDSAKGSLPKYEAVATENGVRITFK